MRIEPEGLTEDHVGLIEGAQLLASRHIHVPPENVNAVAQVTYAYINALGKANAEIERLENLLADAASTVSSYDWS